MKKKLLLVLFAPLMGALALMPHDSFAASQNINLGFSGSGASVPLFSAGAVCDSCLPDGIWTTFSGDPSGPSYGVGASVALSAQATFNPAPASVALNYSAGNLMHGHTLDLTDTLAPQAGTVSVKYSASYAAGVFVTPLNGTDESCGSLSFPCNQWAPDPYTPSAVLTGSISDSDSVACTFPLLNDGTRTCTGTHNITIVNTTLFGFVPVDVEIPITETVTVNGTAVTSIRVAAISGGVAIPNQTLTFSGPSPSTVSDPIAITCSQPIGTDLLYSLTNNSYTATSAPFSLGVGLTLDSISLISFTVNGPDLGPIPMSAPDQQVDLGPVLKNATPPTANAGGPYSGTEGSPVSFDGSGSTSVCGTSSLAFVWNFSDGGVAYSEFPTHTFESPGTFSGQLTVTDPDGNTNTADFSVSITNLAPVVTAGPDMSTPWGVSITLNGSAVDPGTAEQPFLTYSWNFGDGTPSASGGASVSHSYAQPGTYTATFTACDPENACSSATMNVVVVNRNTTTSYTGALAGSITDTVPLKASVVDQYGQAVVGRPVSFSVSGLGTVGSAMTNTSGVAMFNWTIPLGSVGTPTITASFAGDSMYNSSTTAGQTFTISKENTAVAYTGPTSSLPAKSVTFVAVLKTDEGLPIAGKTLYFTLGTQSCHGVTNASGTASCTILLSQTPGNYVIVSAFPNGDPNFNGSSVTSAFKIGH